MSKLFSDAIEGATMSNTGGKSVRDRLQFNSYEGAQRGRYPRSSRGGGSGRARNTRGRGSYPRSGRGGIHPRSRLAEHDDDEDESMGAPVSNAKTSRYNPYGRGSRRSRSRRPSNTDSRSRAGTQRNNYGSSWFKVVVYDCKHIGKNSLIRDMEVGCGIPLDIVEFHWLRDNAGFFIQSDAVAEKLLKSKAGMMSSNGDKISYTVKPSSPPERLDRKDNKNNSNSTNPPIPTEKLEPVLQECLAHKFNVEQQSLNLQDISSDSVLQNHGVRGAFYQPWFANAVLKLIGTLCPTLRGLDLSNNKMRHLSSLRNIATSVPLLETISLANNELSNMEDLKVLKELKKLKAVLLSGNPMLKSYESKPLSYTTEVRTHLPQIETVDGHKLPPPITFDVPEALPLPEFKDNFVGDSIIEQTVSQFIQSYFQVFDSDNRQQLLDAYHDQAVFSVCVNTNVKDSSTNQESLQFGDYFRSSRNMKRITEPAKRANALKITKSAAVATLAGDFPRTKHDLSTFNIDVILSKSSIICFAVRGRFTEVGKNITRAFTRTFAIVPHTSAAGFLIVNDQLQIRNPTSQVVKSNSATSAAPQTVHASPNTSLTGAVSNEKDEMTKKFSEQSKMNILFSRQCLEENNWDYQRAAETFTSLEANGKIPPEAFIA